MIHEIPKPEISPAFTVEDIHKIRDWDYDRLKDATPEERRADTEWRVARIRRTIEELRKAKGVKLMLHISANGSQTPNSVK